MAKYLITLVFTFSLLGFQNTSSRSEWVPLFNGKDLTGWFITGDAKWEVIDGVLTGLDGMGHIYTNVTASDFEAKGVFRISGEETNSGFYFRAVPPPGNRDGFPHGYEAQICHNQDAYTGWLWKPGKPTGKASELLTSDGEWFSYRIKALGSNIQFWVNDKLVMQYDDDEYTEGHFALQGHNPGMKIEARELYFRKL